MLLYSPFESSGRFSLYSLAGLFNQLL